MAKKRNPLVTAMNGGIANAKQTAKTFREMQTMLLGAKSMMRMKYGWVFDKVDESAETYLYASWSHFRNKPEISISMHRLESFKDKRLTDLLYNLCGFTDPVVSEYAEALNKDFKFDLEDAEVTVRAYVKSTSETCRKVKTGTKLVEQDTYKIVCD